MKNLIWSILFINISLIVAGQSRCDTIVICNYYDANNKLFLEKNLWALDSVFYYVDSLGNKRVVDVKISNNFIYEDDKILLKEVLRNGGLDLNLKIRDNSVLVSWILEPDGKITNPRILYKSSVPCSNEFLRKFIRPQKWIEKKEFQKLKIPILSIFIYECSNKVGTTY